MSDIQYPFDLPRNDLKSTGQAHAAQRLADWRPITRTRHTHELQRGDRGRRVSVLDGSAQRRGRQLLESAALRAVVPALAFVSLTFDLPAEVAFGSECTAIKLTQPLPHARGHLRAP